MVGFIFPVHYCSLFDSVETRGWDEKHGAHEIHNNADMDRHYYTILYMVKTIHVLKKLCVVYGTKKRRSAMAERRLKGRSTFSGFDVQNSQLRHCDAVEAIDVR